MYKILEIKPSASQDEIKQAYYKLAKQFHPDFNPLETGADQFRRVQKAYEVLSNPQSRQTYDIENRFNEDLSDDIKDKVYAQKLGKKNYYMTRQMKDFYHTQWTDFKKPKWYHPYNGLDVRSQYLYRKKNDERAWFLPPYVDIAIEWCEINRLYIYFLMFISADFYRLYKKYWANEREKLEFEILNSSFSLGLFEEDEDAMMENEFTIPEIAKTLQKQSES